MARPNIPIPALSEKDKKRFYSKVSTTPTDKGCLEWLASHRGRGYGVFTINNRMFGSHRLAYFIVNGIDPLNLLVRHSCNNPSCVNSAHLSTGSHHDNMRDMVIAGRAATGDRNGRRTQPDSSPRGDKHWSRTKPERLPKGDKHWSHTKPESRPRGEDHGCAKLNDDKVIAIRADQRSQRKIALDYGVHQSTINDIKLHKIWKHVI